MKSGRTKGGYIPSVLKQKILSQIDMRDVLDYYGISYTPSRKNNYTCLCPFHEDHRPSMSIFSGSQAPDGVMNCFKCFSCGEGGDLFSFVTKFESKYNHRHLGPLETAKHIIKMFELDPSIFPEQAAPKLTEDSREQQVTRNLMSAFLRQSEIGRYSPEGAKQIELLIPDDRSDIAGQQHIGYWDKDITKWQILIESSGFRLDDCKKANIFTEENGKWYMPYAGKVIIPLTDQYGKLVCLLGRSVDELTGESRYLMPFKTIFGHARRNLYNFYEALPDIQYGRVYVFENVEDVLNAKKIQMTNSVASLGPLLTSTQIKLLKKAECAPVMVFDKDTTLEERTLALSQAKRSGMMMDILVLESLDQRYQESQGMKDLITAGCTKEELDRCIEDGTEYILIRNVQEHLSVREPNLNKVIDLVHDLHEKRIITHDMEFIRFCELTGERIEMALYEVMQLCEDPEAFSRKRTEENATKVKLNGISLEDMDNWLAWLSHNDSKSASAVLEDFKTICHLGFGKEMESEMEI